MWHLWYLHFWISAFGHKFKTLIDLLTPLVKSIKKFSDLHPPFLNIYKWTVVSLIISKVYQIYHILHDVIKKVVNIFNNRKLKVQS